MGVGRVGLDRHTRVKLTTNDLHEFFCRPHWHVGQAENNRPNMRGSRFARPYSLRANPVY